MGERIPEIEADSYVAAQNVLRNVWYGQPNPIMRAIEYAASKGHPHANEDEVIQSIVLVAERLEEALDRLPSNIHATREKQLRLVTQAQHHLSVELKTAINQCEETEAEIRQMRRRLSGLRGQRNRLRRQLDEEMARIANVETKGLRITVEAQPGYEPEVSRRQRAAIHEAIDEALGCNPSAPSDELAG